MPEQISSYRLENEIARGGMGIVYRGVHMVFEEVVAIKAIYRELMVNPDIRQRFLNEARIQRRLQHPNIVQIREFLVADDCFYIVMELIQGETLAQRLKAVGRPMTMAEAAPIFRQALEGLGFAHSQGVIHRDIKPSNLMLTTEGVTKLTDFGIARGRETVDLTRTGMAVGTASYMSPEQIQGTQIDYRTDIYSLGITLYEVLTGRVPFERPKDSDSDFPVLTAHTVQPPPPPRQFAPSIPASVEAAILKALAKRPEERFQSCAEFQAALGLESGQARDVIEALRAKPVEPVKPSPGIAPNKAAVPAESKPKAPSAARPASRPPDLQPRSAKLARTPTSRPAWVLPLGAILILLLLAAGAWRWYRVRQENFRLVQTFTGHQGEVTSVAFSPYGRMLASGSTDGTVKLWDLATQTLKKTLTGHDDYIEAVSFSPDGHLLATGSADGTIKLWDIPEGDLKQTFKGNGDSILTVAFGPHAQMLAAGGWDSTIEIWDVTTGKLKETLKGHGRPVSSVVFCPDGHLLASASEDKTIKLWNVATGELVKTLTGHEGKVTSVDFNPDGNLLASGSGDTTVKIWDVASGLAVQTFTGHKLWVRSVTFSPDGRLLASGSHDNTIKVWDVPTGKVKQTLRGHGFDVESVAFSRDGQWIASGSADRSIKLWGRYQP